MSFLHSTVIILCIKVKIKGILMFLGINSSPSPLYLPRVENRTQTYHFRQLAKMVFIPPPNPPSNPPQFNL